MFKTLLGGVATIAVVTGTVVGLGYLSYLGYAFYAPRYEQVRRNTFEQSQSYYEGMLRELQGLRLQYTTATTDAEKAVLRSTILHRFSVYPQENLPADLRNFYNSIRN